MLEWVIIEHSRHRDVFVDGRRTGSTNALLIVGRGRHVFDLGEPRTYSPSKHTITVRGTSAVTPRIVTFATA